MNSNNSAAKIGNRKFKRAVNAKVIDNVIRFEYLYDDSEDVNVVKVKMTDNKCNNHTSAYDPGLEE